MLYPMRNLAAAFLFSAIAGPAIAQTPRFNDTGHTTCLRANGQTTNDCAKSGQDAAYGRDAKQSGAQTDLQDSVLQNSTPLVSVFQMTPPLGLVSKI